MRRLAAASMQRISIPLWLFNGLKLRHYFGFLEITLATQPAIY
ncbi:hypothetical protein Q31a_51500 [Aureliella helgolandensis]|uniref:Uncharacterized protein n=1 Tax=Aureliella helgolandensis TaxID=2527968 RepID=A0A518GDU3_9BACT|nr:hypothetical protein Q31a_51500 [Aureliella helgolandensis]